MKQTIAVLLLFASLSPAATRAWMAGGAAAREASRRLAVGANHACAALYDGTVRCWGNNFRGQLGNNATGATFVTTPATVLFLPRPLPGIPLGSIIAVAAGNEFSCALDSFGRVFCWGLNNSGQLGEGTTTLLRPLAGLVSGITNAVRISARASTACALLADGTVNCWGSNGTGQLGDNTTGGIRRLPAPVLGLAGATDIAVGIGYACALVSGGGARCWGLNTEGQLGIGTNDSGSSVPVPVQNLTEAYEITAGFGHTCAITTQGVTKCWGRNSSGELGTGNNQDQSLPTSVLQLNNAVHIRSGNFHNCAVTAAGAVQCWGRNASGQVGDNSQQNRSLPVPVSNLAFAVAVAGGDHHTCAMKADGTISCWGGGEGQLGDPNNPGSLVPVPVFNIAGGVSAKAAATGGSHTCAVRSNSSVACWGRGDSGQLGNGISAADVPNPTAVNGLNGVTSVTTGLAHTCALIGDGTVKCWGQGARGQIGNNNTVDQPTPLTVAGLSGIVAVQAGANYTCALTAANAVFCWGANEFGQLAINGDTQDRRAPSLVAGLTKVVGITTGGNHTCATKADGTVVCWGSGANGQMGTGGTVAINTIPAAVPSLAGIVTIGAGANHSCSLAASGELRCWGRNASGQIGIGVFGGDVPTPTLPAPGLPATAHMTAGGTSHTCAATVNGGAACWGVNLLGQLGLGFFRRQDSPTVVPGLTGVTAIAAGGNTSCAVLAHGGLSCWGDNSRAQIGDGTTENRAAPTDVPSFTLNIVPTVLLSSTNPRKLTVNIIANCEFGDQLKLRVQVRQPNGAAGHGNETTRCTGGMATFPVEIQAQGGTPFSPGAATVEADAEIRGEERTTQSWTRAVNIVVAAQ